MQTEVSPKGLTKRSGRPYALRRPSPSGSGLVHSSRCTVEWLYPIQRMLSPTGPSDSRRRPSHQSAVSTQSRVYAEMHRVSTPGVSSAICCCRRVSVAYVSQSTVLTNALAMSLLCPVGSGRREATKALRGPEPTGALRCPEPTGHPLPPPNSMCGRVALSPRQGYRSWSISARAGRSPHRLPRR